MSAGGDGDDWGTGNATQHDDAGFDEFGTYGASNTFDTQADNFEAQAGLSNDDFDPTTLKAREDFGFNFQTFGVHIIDDLTADMAWDLMKGIAKNTDPDVTKFREAFVSYCKALCDTNTPIDIASMEDTMRAEGWFVHLVAISRPLVPSYTIVGMSGDPGLPYTLSFQASSMPASAKLAQHWPKSHDDNLERLKEAGFAVASNAVICRNCGAVGHVRAKCEAVLERKVVVAKCVYCEGQHHARDCTEVRPTKERKEGGSMACRRCGEEGHMVKDCTEPPRDITCRRCDQEGHMAKDCPEAPPPMTCHLCGEEGHMARECSKERPPRGPRDFSKLPTCKNCNTEGHSAIRCLLPPRQMLQDMSLANDDTTPSATLGVSAPVGASDGW